MGCVAVVGVVLVYLGGFGVDCEYCVVVVGCLLVCCVGGEGYEGYCWGCYVYVVVGVVLGEVLDEGCYYLGFGFLCFHVVGLSRRLFLWFCF